MPVAHTHKFEWHGIYIFERDPVTRISCQSTNIAQAFDLAHVTQTQQKKPVMHVELIYKSNKHFKEISFPHITWQLLAVLGYGSDTYTHKSFDVD